MADPFVIPADIRAKYEAQFARMNPINGYVTGDQARGLFLQSGLPGPALAKIWVSSCVIAAKPDTDRSTAQALADVDGDGKLDIAEFMIAFHLIALKLKGTETPPTLPPPLRALIGRPAGYQSPPSQAPMKPAPPAAAAMPPGRPAPPVAAGPGRPPPPAAAPMPQPVRPVVPAGEWAVPLQAQKKYREQFTMVDSAGAGSLTGVQARGILMQSSLPQGALAQIWQLSDVNVDGKLSVEEFILAMFLIERTRSGMPLPPTLPPELVPPSFRGTPTGPVPPQAITSPLQPVQPVQPVPAAAQPPPRPPPATVDSRRQSAASQGYTSPPQATTPAGGDWAIPQAARLSYTQQFNRVDTGRTGYMTGPQARNVLVQSGLPQNILAQIW